MLKLALGDENNTLLLGKIKVEGVICQQIQIILIIITKNHIKINNKQFITAFECAIPNEAAIPPAATGGAINPARFPWSFYFCWGVRFSRARGLCASPCGSNPSVIFCRESGQSGQMSNVSYHISNLLEKMSSADKDFR